MTEKKYESLTPDITDGIRRLKMFIDELEEISDYIDRIYGGEAGPYYELKREQEKPQPDMDREEVLIDLVSLYENGLEHLDKAIGWFQNIEYGISFEIGRKLV